jgi:hypothetical protein
MAFKVFTDGTTASADEVNDNFYALFQGDRLPMTITAGGTLTAASAAGNIGSATYPWNNLYCGNIYVNSLSVTTPYMFSLKAQVTCTTTTSAISFTGLNGDSAEIIKIDANMPDHGMGYIKIFYINGDSATNYYQQNLQYYTSSIGTSVIGTTTGINVQSGFITIYSKTGKERIVLYDVSWVETTNTALHAAAIWNNTASTLTSLKFTGADEYSTGTTFKIWALN